MQATEYPVGAGFQLELVLTGLVAARKRPVPPSCRPIAPKRSIVYFSEARTIYKEYLALPTYTHSPSHIHIRRIVARCRAFTLVLFYNSALASHFAYQQQKQLRNHAWVIAEPFYCHPGWLRFPSGIIGDADSRPPRNQTEVEWQLGSQLRRDRRDTTWVCAIPWTMSWSSILESYFGLAFSLILLTEVEQAKTVSGARHPPNKIAPATTHNEN